MPEDLLAYMTEDDLIDMAEHLLTLKTPSLTFASWHVIGPFDNGTADEGMERVYPPEKEINLGATVAGKAGQVMWRTVKPNG